MQKRREITDFFARKLDRGYGRGAKRPPRGSRTWIAGDPNKTEKRADKRHGDAPQRKRAYRFHIITIAKYGEICDYAQKSKNMDFHGLRSLSLQVYLQIVELPLIGSQIRF